MDPDIWTGKGDVRSFVHGPGSKMPDVLVSPSPELPDPPAIGPVHQVAKPTPLSTIANRNQGCSIQVAVCREKVGATTHVFRRADGADIETNW